MAPRRCTAARPALPDATPYAATTEARSDGPGSCSSAAGSGQSECPHRADARTTGLPVKGIYLMTPEDVPGDGVLAASSDQATVLLEVVGPPRRPIGSGGARLLMRSSDQPVGSGAAGPRSTSTFPRCANGVLGEERHNDRRTIRLTRASTLSRRDARPDQVHYRGRHEETTALVMSRVPFCEQSRCVSVRAGGESE